MTRSGLAIGVALCAAACAPDPIRVAIPPEYTAGHRSVVVALEHGAVELAAVDLASGQGAEALPAIADYRGEALVRVSVLAYDAPLAALGLAPGSVRTVSPSDPARHGPLPVPAAAFTAVVQGRGAEAWQEVEGVVGPLAELQVALAGNGCATFEAISTTLTSTVDPAGVVAFGGADALVAMFDGQLFRVTAAGVRPVAFDAPELAPRSLWLESLDAVYVGGARGDLSRLRIARFTGGNDGFAVEPVSTSSRATQLMAIEGDRTGAIYTLDEEGTIQRWIGGEWTELFTLPRTNLPKSGRVLATGPGQALVVWGGTRSVARITDRVRVAIEEVPDSVVGVEAAALVPGLGQVIADGRGRVFRHQDGAWREMPGSGVFRKIRAILPYAEGFLFAGDGGVVGQWLPSVGFCTPARLAPDTVKWAVPFGDDVLLLGARMPETYATAVTVLKRR